MMPGDLALPKADAERFSRQILVDEIGVEGHKRISRSSVLIIGAGGLGSPAALYLAAAGVERIGLVDYDTVDTTNLHRQIVHREDRVGQSKVESTKATLQGLNSQCIYEAFDCLLHKGNALEIIDKFDVILDCTDNAVTRYLINDACVLARKPLVSGAALRLEGQLTTYNFNETTPCYRCLYPLPPNADLVVNCDEGGVLGPVTGVIGSLQALEALRIIANNEASYAGKLLLFNGLGGSFRTVKLRPRNPNCSVCGLSPALGLDLMDYEVFCGAAATDKRPSLKVLEQDNRLTCQELANSPPSNHRHIIDVRPASQFSIFSLHNSTNIPFEQLKDRLPNLLLNFSRNDEIVFVCRRGNHSQLAVQMLKEAGHTSSKDLIGGLRQYALEIDRSLPFI